MGLHAGRRLIVFGIGLTFDQKHRNLRFVVKPTGLFEETGLFFQVWVKPPCTE